MYKYRICKYNPICRGKDGVYRVDEWTDYSDIGSVFNGSVLSLSEYLQVENNYISCVMDVLYRQGIKKLSIRTIEKREKTKWKNGRISDKKIAFLIRDCLRNKCWCRLTERNFYLHFGYDYYIYLGCLLPVHEISAICKKNHLYYDMKESPYLSLKQKKINNTKLDCVEKVRVGC